MVNYEVMLDDVIDNLEGSIKACTNFTSESVHVDYFRTADYGTVDPICLIHLQRDEFEAIGPHLTQHTLEFQVIVKHTGEGTKTNLKEIVLYVGEIVNKIEADRTLGSTYVDVDGATVIGIEYSMSTPSSGVIYSAYLTLTVRAIRNA